MSKERSKSGWIAVGSYIFFAHFFLFLMLAVLSYRTHQVQSAQHAYLMGFIPIQAQVTKHEKSLSPNGVAILTHYTFTPPGSSQAAVGKDRFIPELFSTEAEADREIAQMKSVTVYYSPENPADSSHLPPPPDSGRPRFFLILAFVSFCAAMAAGIGRVLWDRFWRPRDVESVRVSSLGTGLVSLWGSALVLAVGFVLLSMMVSDWVYGLSHFQISPLVAVGIPLLGAGWLRSSIAGLKGSFTSYRLPTSGF